MDDFKNKFPDEKSCIDYIEKIRETNGLTCDKCQSHEFIKDRFHKRWVCKSCRHAKRFTSGTIMHGTKTKLLYWFTTIYHLTNTDNILSSMDLLRLMGCPSPVTAQTMHRRIRSVMSKYLTDNNISRRIDENSLREIESYHLNISAKYKQSYIDEFIFRNRPENKGEAGFEHLLKLCIAEWME